jgi:hypothetical protein
MNKIKPLNLFIILFFSFVIILYRDFLYTYRMQLENFLPYYHYQDQIIYYLTGDKSYDVEAPMNLRFLGLVLQYLIYQSIPCFELTDIKSNLSNMYTCATYSNALMNYFSLCAIASLMFVYTYKKKNFDLSSSILSVLFSIIFIIHLEAFTLDRIAVLYFMLILYFLDRKYISYFLIILASLVNEKIIFMMCILFFIRWIFLKDRKYLNYFFAAMISGITMILIFVLYSFYFKNGYWGQENPTSIYNTIFTNGIKRVFRIFYNPQGISGGLIPLLICLFPYLLNHFFKIVKKNYAFSNCEFLIPVALIIFGAGGGTTNIGRYVMYSFPLWVPILSLIIVALLNKKNKV